jgi:hypothetical protein
MEKQVEKEESKLSAVADCTHKSIYLFILECI